MKSLVFVSVLLVAVHTTDRQEKIMLIWGEDTNVTRAEAILAEEAQKLGISVYEYFNSCAADVETMKFTKEEEADMKKEREAATKMSKIKVNTRDELYDESKVRAPKMYAALARRREVFNKTVSELDSPAQTFVKTELKNISQFRLGDTFLDSVNRLSESKAAGKSPNEIFAMLGPNVKKIKSEYDALPQESKNSLERNFCIRSSIRIVNSDGILKNVLSGIIPDL